MISLWMIDEFLSAIHGRPIGDMPEAIDGISIDSRTVGAGDAFFAIKGDRFDGHEFIPAAGRAGAVVAIAGEHRIAALGSANMPLAIVDDVLAALGRLGVAARNRSEAKIIAVTGSVGKTSTKELLHHSLGSLGTTHAAQASFNNHWGVPLTLARMPKTAAFGVFEIGMNHPGEIEPLVAMVRPHVALVTNVGAAHLGAFDSLDDIARAKAEIFSGMVDGGVAVINGDDERCALLRRLAKAAGAAQVTMFGTGKKNHVRLEQVTPLELGSRVDLRVGKTKLSFKLALAGRHMALNAAAAVAAADAAGIDCDKLVEGFSTVTAAPGRGDQLTLSVGGESLLVVDESYNANPASMAAALDLLAETPLPAGGRKIAVLGDMLELGKASKTMHEDLAVPIARSGADLVFLAGPQMVNLRDVLETNRVGGYADNALALGPILLEMVRGGDIILFKASNGLNFARLVKLLREHFPPHPNPDQAPAE